MTDPDIELVEATGRGDPVAFESLVKRYQGPLLSFIARYLGDRTQAEDIAQEVFIRIYRAAPRFEPKHKVSTWLFRIAYNQVLTELGRRKRGNLLRESLRFFSRFSASSTQPSRSRDLREEIMPALMRLPEKQRAALLLRVNEELSYQEVAEVLGVSVASVESLLFRARANLKRRLEKI